MLCMKYTQTIELNLVAKFKLLPLFLISIGKNSISKCGNRLNAAYRLAKR